MDGEGGRDAVWLKKTASDGEPCIHVARGHQAEVADFDEAPGQDVKQEAADEFMVGQSGSAAVLGGKADTVLVHGDEALIGDGHPMRVAAQVLVDMARAAEGGFGVDHPVLRV